MVYTSTHSDPVVEILRLAYRRGLALRQAQEKERSAAVNFDQVKDALFDKASLPDEEGDDVDDLLLIGDKNSEEGQG
jgi:hypothetical protein